MAVPLSPPGDQAHLFQQVEAHPFNPRPLHQPIAGQRSEAEAEAAHRLTQETALAKVTASRLGDGIFEQALLKFLGRPADCLKHKSAALRLR